jgi:hypothetical protein
MSEISVGAAVGEGFGLIARRPLSVLFWGALRVGFVAMIFVIYVPLFINFFIQAAQAGASGGKQASAAAVTQMMSQMLMMQGMGFLVQIVGVVLSSMIYCAVIRAVVHPEVHSFGSVRLGSAELYCVLLSFGLGFVLAFALPFLIIPLALVAAVLAAGHHWLAMAITIGLGVVVLILGLILVALRFVFVVPMMVDDGKFHLFESWSLTKGRVGSLFGIGALLLLIGILVELVLGLLLAGLVVGALALAAGGVGNIPALFEAHKNDAGALIAILAPSLILLALLFVPIEGGLLAIFVSPWARAYRDVVPSGGAPIVAPPPSAAPIAATP